MVPVHLGTHPSGCRTWSDEQPAAATALAATKDTSTHRMDPRRMPAT
jgi:hypothetical protein